MLEVIREPLGGVPNFLVRQWPDVDIKQLILISNAVTHTACLVLNDISQRLAAMFPINVIKIEIHPIVDSGCFAEANVRAEEASERVLGVEYHSLGHMAFRKEGPAQLFVSSG